MIETVWQSALLFASLWGSDGIDRMPAPPRRAQVVSPASALIRQARRIVQAVQACGKGTNSGQGALSGGLIGGGAGALLGAPCPAPPDGPYLGMARYALANPELVKLQPANGALTQLDSPAIPGGAAIGAVAGTALGAAVGGEALFPPQRTQVFFTRPASMRVYWYTSWSPQAKDGGPSYSTEPLFVPARYNFAQAAIYRLKLTNLPGREGLELYPTLEVLPTGPRTNEFLAHNSVPVEFTEEDFKHVVDGNYLVKVIYLPDPKFQDVTGAGPDQIVSTRLEPGQDPIQEAMRRGSILLVLRMGNIDQGVQPEIFGGVKQQIPPAQRMGMPLGQLPTIPNIFPPRPDTGSERLQPADASCSFQPPRECLHGLRLPR